MEATKCVGQILKSLEVGEPRTISHGFIVFPLLSEGEGVRGYITLDEALKEGLVTIPESYDVPEIVIEVKGEKPVLVVEGDIVVGGVAEQGSEHIPPS